MRDLRHDSSDEEFARMLDSPGARVALLEVKTMVDSADVRAPITAIEQLDPITDKGSVHF